MDDISAWRAAVEETVSLLEAHRALKIWRALWKVSAALRYCVRDADPSLGVRNTAASGRSATWTEGEAARLFKRAYRQFDPVRNFEHAHGVHTLLQSRRIPVGSKTGLTTWRRSVAETTQRRPLVKSSATPFLAVGS
jgi:hypothetical protein